MSVSRPGALMELVAPTSARPAVNRPASRTATTRLRRQSTDQMADADPQRTRQPSSAPTVAKAVHGFGPLVDNTSPTAHSPAAEMSAATPLGTMTRSGKKDSAVVSMPASHQTAVRVAIRAEVNRDKADGTRSSLSIAVDICRAYRTCRRRSAARIRGIFRSRRRKRLSHERRCSASRNRAPNLLRSIRQSLYGCSPERHLPDWSLP